MKVKQFKTLIKESVKEVLIEEGVLSKIISEVLQGLNSQQQLVSDSREKITEIQEDVAKKSALSKRGRKCLNLEKECSMQSEIQWAALMYLKERTLWQKAAIQIRRQPHPHHCRAFHRMTRVSTFLLS